MYTINKTIEDYSQPGNKSYVNLEPDQALHPSIIKYPLTWHGRINGKEAVIVQSSTSSSTVADFEFQVFPDSIMHLKHDIARLIDEKLHIMD